MHLISGNTVSNTVLQAFHITLQGGEYIQSRNGGCSSIYDVTFEVKNPRSRHLHLEGRKSNIFALIAETFWVMAGQDAVHPYLDFFLPRAPDYSDDGKVWHGAYGPRMYRYDQFKDAVNVFETDSLQTRRSFVTISDPISDNQGFIESMYGMGHKAKDIPCNREMHFYVERGKFCAKTIQRSGDLIFGTGSINPFEFSFIQELMYNEVKKLYPEVELGPYRWHVTNAHLYDFSRAQAVAAIGSTVNNQTSQLDQNAMPIIGPGVDQWQDFFGDIVEIFTESIVCPDEHFERVYGNLLSHMGHTFVSYNVPLENNLMWKYVQAVAHYIASKRGIIGEFDVSDCDAEFQRAIVNSSFRKFDLVYTV